MGDKNNNSSRKTGGTTSRDIKIPQQPTVPKMPPVKPPKK